MASDPKSPVPVAVTEDEQSPKKEESAASEENKSAEVTAKGSSPKQDDNENAEKDAKGSPPKAAKTSPVSLPENLQSAKDRFMQMEPDVKRSLYRCGEKYVTLDKVLDWKDYYVKTDVKEAQVEEKKYEVSGELNSKVSLWQGDITALEIDSIVNAANCSLLGGGGVDGAIHRAAGRGLLYECRELNGCKEGDAKITGGYKLPSKYVIHTVGPQGEKPPILRSCYTKSLDLMLQNNLRTIAFPCISTGIYGYPRVPAAHVALSTVREFLKDNSEKVDRVIFTVFLEDDKKAYEQLMQTYFPLPPKETETA